MSDPLLTAIVARRQMPETRNVTVELQTGRVDQIDDVTDDTFVFYPVPGQVGNNFVALVLTTSIGQQYKYPLALVLRWITKPVGN
jgi:hypothetical protein